MRLSSTGQQEAGLLMVDQVNSIALLHLSCVVFAIPVNLLIINPKHLDLEFIK